MKQPLEVFLYNWECVKLSLEAESEAMEQAKKDAKSGRPTNQMDFDEWMAEVSKENASNYKERKYGIKKRKH